MFVQIFCKCPNQTNEHNIVNFTKLTGSNQMILQPKEKQMKQIGGNVTAHTFGSTSCSASLASSS